MRCSWAKSLVRLLLGKLWIASAALAVAHCSWLKSSLTCDYLGRKMAIVFTTLMIVIGGILATASHGVTIDGMFWMMTVARGVVGFGKAMLFVLLLMF